MFVKIESLGELEVGDMVRHVSQMSYHPTFIVTGNYGTHVTAVASRDLSQPNEWEVFRETVREEDREGV